MATPASTDETSEIRRRGRRRLIGAIAIVVLLVVFVPMLLDSTPPRSPDEPTMKIPPRDNAPALPAPGKAPLASAVLTPGKALPPDTTAAATPAPAPQPATVTPAATAPAPQPAAAAAPAKAAPRLEGFAVQVGAFRDEETLKQARAKLAGAGVKYYTERLDASGLIRLRAGPFPTREAAEKALAALKRASIDGKVVPLP